MVAMSSNELEQDGELSTSSFLLPIVLLSANLELQFKIIFILISISISLSFNYSHHQAEKGKRSVHLCTYIKVYVCMWPFLSTQSEDKEDGL
jgi:hypothetical protein